MKGTTTLSLFVVCLTAALASGASPPEGWISLFDGTTLAGWKAAENPRSVRVEAGAIVTNGRRAHLFYTGPVEQHDFRNFEFRAEVKTEPGANAGIYFHTKYQETGWPSNGYEVQINNSYARDPVRTGSLYHVRDVTKAPVPDGEWSTVYLMVFGKRILITVNGAVTVDYTEPATLPPARGRFKGRRLSSGTFALQAHDPHSTVYFRNLQVRLLPVVDFPIVDYHVHLKGGLTLEEALAIAKRRGVTFGIAQNCGLGFPVTDDAGALRFIEQLKRKPCYVGMQAEGREWVRLFSKEVIARFDYVFTDAMTFHDASGRRTRLWIDREVHIDDKQTFMDLYVGKIVSILENEPIDIYVNPTFLPRVIAREYDALWTAVRMDRVIQVAVKNDVAIEINARYKLPSAAFIRRAKQAGVTFAFGTNNGGRDLGELRYCLHMVRACGLTKDDMFTPRPHGKKPVQVRN